MIETTTRHTPGPWRVEGNGVVSSSPHMGADVCQISARFGSDTARADARLIAAAPELLAALREAARLYTGRGLVAEPVAGEPMAAGKWINTARAAIKKAEGVS